jgi:hypothetical protein
MSEMLPVPLAQAVLPRVRTHVNKLATEPSDALQKVVGSSPIIRSNEKPRWRGAFVV